MMSRSTKHPEVEGWSGEPLEDYQIAREQRPPELLTQNRQRQHIAIFIHGANLFYAAMHLNVEIDYTKLLRCLRGDRPLTRAYFYTGIDPSNERQYGFLLWMRRNGYRVVTKELLQLPDGSKKVNLDVEMTIDMMRLSQSCHTIVLLNGDGALTYALDRIAYQGVRVEVVSLRSMTSDSLIDVADRYIDLEAIQNDIAK